MFANRLIEQMDRVFGPVGYDSPPYPSLNIWEDKDNFYVESELPGLKLEDIQVSVAEGNQLTIAGERTRHNTENTSWIRHESAYGKFSRVISLPAAVDSNKVAANYEAGVLTLTLPKSEAAKPRRIAVKPGAQMLSA
jgi:HSP20 family protein